jgi:hypothetical protein
MNRTIMHPRRQRLAVAIAAGWLVLLVAPLEVQAQGLVQGVEQGAKAGAKAGSKAAGPVGGVLGGAIGGVVGVVGGVLGAATGTSNNNNASGPVGGSARPSESSQPAAAQTKEPREAKGKKAVKNAMPAPTQAPVELTAEQIVANSDANIERIKTELKLTPEQEKHWTAFNSAMHYLGHNGADRLNLRKARALRDPPDDIVEQMRNEAQFLFDRGNDQRAVADAADPLFASLDAKQKAIFIEEMVRLSRERGLD